MKQRHVFNGTWLAPLLLALTLTPGVVEAADVVTVPGVRFSNLTGPDGAIYNGHTEGDFTVTATAGNWFQSMFYGSTAPSIFDGPAHAPGIAVIDVTDSQGLFTLSSLDYSSNNGSSGYHIQGFLGVTPQYEETGILTGSFSPFSFRTLITMHPTIQVDALLIELIPGAGVTSINLDNLNVLTVPEPRGLLLLAGAFAAWVRYRGFGLTKKH